MSTIDRLDLRDRLMHTCTWCLESIPSDQDIYAFSTGINPGIDLSDKEGEFVKLSLSLHDKTLVALIPTAHSKTRQEGFGLLFITCSKACAQELKNALELEREVFKKIN